MQFTLFLHNFIFTFFSAIWITSLVDLTSVFAYTPVVLLLIWFCSVVLIKMHRLLSARVAMATYRTLTLSHILEAMSSGSSGLRTK